MSSAALRKRWEECSPLLEAQLEALMEVEEAVGRVPPPPPSPAAPSLADDDAVTEPDADAQGEEELAVVKGLSSSHLLFLPVSLSLSLISLHHHHHLLLLLHTLLLLLFLSPCLPLGPELLPWFVLFALLRAQRWMGCWPCWVTRWGHWERFNRSRRAWPSTPGCCTRTARRS